MKITVVKTQLFTDMKFPRADSALFFARLVVFAAFLIVAGSIAANAQTSGEWTAQTDADKPGVLNVVFSRRIMDDSASVYQTDRPVAFGDLQNFAAPTASSDNSKVNFKLAREAGTFEFEGLFKDGKGSGVWTLTPNRSFVEAMRARGYANLSIYDLFSATVSDVTTRYVEDLKSAGYGNLEFAAVLLARSNDITADFIREAQSAGFKDLSIEKLIKLKKAK